VTNLRSDNNYGLIPEARAGFLAAADGDAVAYGDDAYTERAVQAIKALFGRETAVFFVATGTAANTLAIASLTEPWQRVLCHSHSHWADDESTAPERFTLCRTVGVSPSADPTRLRPSDLATVIHPGRDVHSPAPGVITLSNPTEFGTVYSPADVAAIVRFARDHGYRVHVDGARFANAVAGLGVAPADLTWRAGVDVLCFGGTKMGLPVGEAVVFFDRRLAEDFAYRCKQAGQLASKMRFLSAPWLGILENDSWLRHAAHANAMARRLASGLAEAAGLQTLFPVDANGVFVHLPGVVEQGLRARGWLFYTFIGAGGARLMCGWDTAPETVDRFLADVRELLAAS